MVPWVQDDRAAARVGIGLRRPHFDALLACERPIDFLEFVPETFDGVGGRARRVLDALREKVPLVPHGVSLSLGGPDPFDAARFARLRALCRAVGAPFYSDHLCLSSIGGVESFDLLPLPFCEAAARHLCERIVEARARLELPLVLENITYYATMPGSDWDEGRFLTHVLEVSDGSLLLDVSNVLVNARNHGIDPITMLERLPLDRVVQIHLAGHRFEPRFGLWIDDHASAVPEAALSLYVHALRRIGRRVPTLIEWDQHVPALDEVLDQADRVRALQEAVFAGAGP